MTSGAHEAVKANEPFDPFAGPVVEGVAPTTAPQRELLAASALGSDASCAYNEAVTLTFDGPLDVPALRAALDDLPARRDALRASFTPDGTTFAVVGPAPVPWQETIVRGGDDVFDATVRTAEREAVTIPFDLANGPLLRAHLVHGAGERRVLVLATHHVACDGWSFGLLLRDLALAYEHRRLGTAVPWTPVPTMLGHARDAAPPSAAALRWWLDQYADSAPVLDLPLDAPRPRSRQFASARCDVALDPALIGAVRAFAAREGTTATAVLHAAWVVLLARLAGQDDLVVGVPSAGQVSPGLADLVGHLVATLPVRHRLAPGADARAVVRAVGDRLLDAFEHRDLTFGDLLAALPMAREPGRVPLAAVLFNVDQPLTGESLGFRDLAVSVATTPRAFDPFELSLNVVEAHGTWRLECQYASALFDGATIGSWLRAYGVLLDGMVRTPDVPVGLLRLADDAGLADVRRWSVGRSLPQPVPGVLHRIAQRVAAHPDKVAVTLDGRHVSYGNLWGAAEEVGRRLRTAGVQPGDRVGVALERSPVLLAALLGAWHAGAAYVPIDLTHPLARRDLVASDADWRAIIVDEGIDTSPTSLEHLQIALEADLLTRSGVVAPAVPPVDPDATAYVLYTSGSTGVPKGVVVPHRAVAAFLTAMLDEPGIRADDTWLAVTTPTFDIAALELFGPLVAGGTVRLAPTAALNDGRALGARLDGVTVMQATPSTWRLLLAAGWTGDGRLRALSGGEALTPDLADALRQRAGEVWNLYGPTETTIWSAVHRVAGPEAAIAIGRPIAGTMVAVVDDGGHPGPVGCPGELGIGGAGVADGCWRRDALTQARFVDAAGWWGDATMRAYRTGDRVRWRADGQLRFDGRVDGQVKVRGVRLELGDVESALRAVPGVADAAAFVDDHGRGDVRLLAWVTPVAGRTLDGTAVRLAVKDTLPPAMLPAAVGVLPLLPRTPNGKLDRRALPAMVPDEPTVDAGPATDEEAEIASIVAGVLGVPRVGRRDDFFDLGGHSLAAVWVLQRLRDATGVDVPLRTFFDAPTVEALARAVAAGEQAADPGPTPRAWPDGLRPASIVQTRMWYLEQLHPGTATHHLPSAFRLTGALDVSRFTRALAAVVARHEALRSTLVADDDGMPWVQVHEAFDITLAPVAVAGDTRDARRAAAAALASAAARRPFDLSRGPLWHAALYQVADDEHLFMFTPHHAVFDGWSFDVVLRDLMAAYAAGDAAPAWPVLACSYADFAAWQRERLTPDRRGALARFWQDALAGAQRDPLTADRPVPAERDLRSGYVSIVLDGVEMRAVRSLARHLDVTTYTILLAAFTATVQRLEGRDDLVIGTPVRGRRHGALDPLVGFFVNTLLLRSRDAASRSLGDVARRLRADFLAAEEHQDAPLEELLDVRDTTADRSGSLFQAMFSFQDVRNRTWTMGDIAIAQQDVFTGQTLHDLTLWVKDDGAVVRGWFEFAEDRFDRWHVEAIRDLLRHLLVAAEASPETPIADLPLAPSAWGVGPSLPDDADDWLAALASQVRRHPQRVAVTDDDGALSYQAVWDASARIAASVRERVGAARVVGVAVSPGRWLPAAVVGIARSGCAWMPLDPQHPIARLTKQCRDADVAALLADAQAAEELAGLGVPIIALDTALEAAPGAEVAFPPPDATAFVRYTSGSTGAPKGVEVGHGALGALLAAIRREPGLREDDVVVSVTSHVFDIAELELLLPLMVGARVRVARAGYVADGDRLRDLLRAEAGTVLQATPTTWRLLVDAGWEGRLRAAWCGGEALKRSLADALLARADEVWNMYGPTETTIYSTVSRVDPSPAPIVIGRPIAGTRVAVVDQAGRPLPVGASGELWIGGRGVALGYRGQPALTAERFVRAPALDGLRAYRTGDKVRWRPDGVLEHLGRLDAQVKLRGVRIELGEIEAVMSTHPAIAACAAAVRELGPGDERLVLYVAFRPGQTLTATDVRRHARTQLPEGMIPSLVQPVDRLPMTATGKVDRGGLPMPMASTAPRRGPTGPGDATLLGEIATIFRDVLRVDEVNATDNFFFLGGHSLLSLRAIARIESRFGVRLPARLLLSLSVAEVAATVERSLRRTAQGDAPA